MKLAPLPRSKAKTAFGLLSEIRKIILAEPKRYNQHDTLRTTVSPRDGVGEIYPSCGTIGCVGGWVWVLKHPRLARRPTGKYVDFLEAAREILGLDRRQSGRLFDGDAAGELGWALESRREHAKRGAAHIAKFQARNAAQLKRTRV